MECPNLLCPTWSFCSIHSIHCFWAFLYFELASKRFKLALRWLYKISLQFLPPPYIITPPSVWLKFLNIVSRPRDFDARELIVLNACTVYCTEEWVLSMICLISRKKQLIYPCMCMGINYSRTPPFWAGSDSSKALLALLHSSLMCDLRTATSNFSSTYLNWLVRRKVHCSKLYKTSVSM